MSDRVEHKCFGARPAAFRDVDVEAVLKVSGPTNAFYINVGNDAMALRCGDLDTTSGKCLKFTNSQSSPECKWPRTYTLIPRSQAVEVRPLYLPTSVLRRR